MQKQQSSDCVVDDHCNRRQYVMLGQAQLELRDVTQFTKKATFDLNFVEKIKVSMR